MPVYYAIAIEAGKGLSMQIVVTDLTRFNTADLLCLAGLTSDGTRCIRPLQANVVGHGYLNYATCQQYSILPGTILEGDFSPIPGLMAPHIEDCHFKSLTVCGICSSSQFKDILSTVSVSTFDQGFQTNITNKVIAVAPNRSIITLKIAPAQIEIEADGYNPNKIKAHIRDGSGYVLRYLPITDLGFYDFVGNVSKRRMSVNQINTFIATQQEVFLRIGLSRYYTEPSGNRSGYWLQVNGIYTFPDYAKIIRHY